MSERERSIVIVAACALVNEARDVLSDAVRADEIRFRACGNNID
jgi:hypothetical protein